jgi:hypothetical protein
MGESELRIYQVTVMRLREYSATIAMPARSQAEADRAAIAAFHTWACEEGCQALPLGFPPPWKEHESIDREPQVDTRFRCVDCGKDTSSSGEYYSVRDTFGPPQGSHRMAGRCAWFVSKGVSNVR